MEQQMRFLLIFSVILFLAVPIHAAESIITEGINSTITTDSSPSYGSGSSSDGTYPRNHGGGGGGYYRATPIPNMTDMPVVVTETHDEIPSHPANAVNPTPTATIEPTETPITLPGFELLFAGLALFGIYALRAKRT